MPKLHELLSTEGNLKSQAESCRADLQKTFQSKGHHFSKKIVTFKPLAEGAETKVESQLDLQTSVTKELAWIGEKLQKVINAGHAIDIGNTQAVADIVLDNGKTLLAGIPGTSLLRLERRITEIKELIKSIPTLDPAKGFELDIADGTGHYKAKDDTRPRTEKKFSYVVMVPATPEHPAQVKELMVDQPTGTLLTQEWSSLISVSDKGDMLDRVEELLRAVKRARSRANEIELTLNKGGVVKIGSTIWDFIVGA